MARQLSRREGTGRETTPVVPVAPVNVLIVDVDRAAWASIATSLSSKGHVVEFAGGVREAEARLACGNIDVVLCNVRLPDGSGPDLVRRSRLARSGPAFVIVTDRLSTEGAVEAMRAGAVDYLAMPLRDVDAVLERVQMARTMAVPGGNSHGLEAAVAGRSSGLFRPTAPSMREVEHLIDKIAPTDCTILISGESGTGKGILARSIHERSQRRDKPFIAVKCSAIPEHLLETEFFGHAEGTPPSSDGARKGLLQESAGGTLFLEEICALPLHMQALLLNVIEDKQVRRPGGEQILSVDSRIIAATNRDLAELVGELRFRKDLYFRLTMFHIPLRPLRERRADIPALIRYFLKADPDNESGRGIAIDAAAEQALLAYDWPGNVRELDNVIQRARILASGETIRIDDLPSEMLAATFAPGRNEGASGRAKTLKQQLRNYEVQMILKTVADEHGNTKLAAERLGIGVSSLYRKLKGLQGRRRPRAARNTAARDHP